MTPSPAGPKPAPRRQRFYHMILSILSTLALVYIVACAVLYANQEKLIFHPEVLPTDYVFHSPDNPTEVTIDADGAKLNALYFSVPHPRGIVVYFHGNGGSLRTWASAAHDFLAHGYNVLLPDYRGYGKSSGSITDEAMLLADADHVYDFAMAHFPEREIIVCGRSLGTGIATHLARTHRPKTLILISPYYSLADLAHQKVPFFPTPLLKYRLRTDLWITNVACPVYLFHGDSDPLIPHSASERLLPRIRTEHRLFTVHGAGHNDIGSFPEYDAGMAEILK